MLNKAIIMVLSFLSFIAILFRSKSKKELTEQEVIRTNQKKYRPIEQCNKEYHEANKAERSEYKRNWYQENKERISLLQKEYKQRNKAKISQYQKEWFQKKQANKKISNN